MYYSVKAFDKRQVYAGERIYCIGKLYKINATIIQSKDLLVIYIVCNSQLLGKL